MKYLLKAILALSAIAGSLAAPPLDCTPVTPKKGDVWEMGKAQTVSWNCKTDGPLEKQPATFLIHIELGTGKPDAFTYTDTIDAIAKAKEVKFTWVLLDKYKAGSDYIVRLRSKLKGDPDPANADEANKLKWAYSDNFKIVAAGGGDGGNAGGNDKNNSTTPGNNSGSGGSGNGGNGGSGGGSSGGSSGGSGSSSNSTSGGSPNNSTTPTSSGNPAAGAMAMSANIVMLLTTIMAVFVAGVFY